MHRPDRCLDEGQGIRRVRTAEEDSVVLHRDRETARHPHDLPLELGKLDLLERDGRTPRIVPALDAHGCAGECSAGIEPDPLPVALDRAASRRVQALQEAEPERVLGPLHRLAPARLTESEEGLEVRDAAAVVPDHEAHRVRLVREDHARGAGAPRVLQELRDDGVPVREGEPEVFDEAPLVEADGNCFGHACLLERKAARSVPLAGWTPRRGFVGTSSGDAHSQKAASASCAMNSSRPENRGPERKPRSCSRAHG